MIDGGASCVMSGALDLKLDFKLQIGVDVVVNAAWVVNWI
jgi:hypothetical protein